MAGAGLEVFYGNDHLRVLAESHRDLCKVYGQVGAKRILQRVQLLKESDSLDDVMQGPGGCHPLKGDYKDCYSLRLHAGWRLVFQLMTDAEKKTLGVGSDQAALVIEIVDYHDG